MGLCAHIDDDDFLATACLHKICLARSMRNSKGQQQQNQQAADREDRQSERGEEVKKGVGEGGQLKSPIQIGLGRRQRR